MRALGRLSTRGAASLWMVAACFGCSESSGDSATDALPQETVVSDGTAADATTDDGAARDADATGVVLDASDAVDAAPPPDTCSCGDDACDEACGEDTATCPADCPPECTAATCEALSLACGTAPDDGCGAPLDCGPCASPIPCRDGACEDHDPCTVDHCDAATDTCVHPLAPGACGATLLIEAGQGGTLRDDVGGVEVVIPAEAVPEAMEVAVGPAPDLLLLPVDESLGNLVVRAPFTFSPAGHVFEAPVQVRLPVHGEALAEGTAVTILYRAADGSAWGAAALDDGSAIDAVAAGDGRSVVFETDHFSSYAFGVITTCQPDCEGKVCGADGCGRLCGTCPAGSACGVAGRCIETEACDGAADGSPCDDDNACTDGDACDDGACVGGPPADCDDDDVCTDDVCHPVTGCNNFAANDGAACDDGRDCTVGDNCFDGVCAGTAASRTDATCDGVDDDCDGVTDDDFVGETTSCGRGACAATGTTHCEDGTLRDDCEAGAAAADDASCDGIDDDCDGLTDEDFVGAATTCGEGPCASTGETSCAGGAVVDSCEPGGRGGEDASCDGVDDDCDGRTDEDFQSEETTCGTGACEAAGATSCIDGVVRDSCVERDAAADDATCDGVDDDCDGDTDEEFQSSDTACGVGACAATGATACVAGAIRDGCEPRPANHRDASCNGVDDDCDGDTDEDFAGVATTCGRGACAASGETRCEAGQVVDGCEPGAGATEDATCDGVDDDCDDVTDEDYRSEVTTCGAGGCRSEGTTSCIDGDVVDSCVSSGAGGGDATCNGIDDDCDGDTDEDYSPRETSCGVGACAATGVTACLAGEETDSCTPAAAGAGDATCDGVDDDCDGRVDEDHLGEPTTCGVGACAARGAATCINGALQDSCEPGVAATQDATCDGVDDDCDGRDDEDYASRATTCGVGGCAREGVTSCVDGSEVDSCAAGDPAADDATCDGVDDDCDHEVDEDVPVVESTCGTGACTAFGTARCAGGALVDSCVPAMAADDDITCDGIDDDCDGLIDEDGRDACGVCGGGGPPCATCETASDGAACDDGDACTTDDACAAGVCVGAGGADCDDGNDCTVDDCAPDTGCLHEAAAREGEPCDAGSGAGSGTCTDATCVEHVGACCRGSGACDDDVSAGACHATGGSLRPGGACLDAPCPLPDTCGDGACDAGEETTCVADCGCAPACAGDCGRDGCGGRCGDCADDLVCHAGVCGAAGACDGGACDARGACCLPHGGCADGLAEADCAGAGHVWHAASACGDVACAGPPTCDDAGGVCALDGGCFADGDTNPATGCEICRAATPGAWTVLDGEFCDAGPGPRSGLCDGSVCVAVVCGDARCEGDETAARCPQDCGPAGYVAVPNGLFTLGSPADELGRGGDEDPRAVTIDAGFWLKATEVTQAEWVALTGAPNPSAFPACGATCPADAVTWWEALWWCNARSAEEGLAACYTLVDCIGQPGAGMTCTSVTVEAPDGDPRACEGYRLPTEDEWEHAARAGTGSAYYSGELTAPGSVALDPRLDAIGWYAGNSAAAYGGAADCEGWFDGAGSCGPQAVAGRAANAWGLHDTAGNVAEWIWDRHPGTSATARGVRGGSWSSPAEDCRAARRGGADPDAVSGAHGFRPARTVPGARPCAGDADCDDGNPCSTDLCAEGACTHAPTVCADENPCATFACEAIFGAAGCMATPTDGACSDEDACTEGDACSAGACEPGEAISCDDEDACTVDACDSATGACSNTPVDCDDDQFCTSDSCAPETGLCSHAPINCDDGDPCTTDVCDLELQRCTNTPVDCDDGDGCTTNLCDEQSGECINEPFDCSDGLRCTDDICDPVEARCFNPAIDCDDDDPCTGDLCDEQSGDCLNVAFNCNDFNPCTTDFCDPEQERCINEDMDCDDGDACTDDACDPETVLCGSTATTCDDGEPCTIDACDPSTGCTADAHEPDGTACDDGDATTSDDQCTAGVCAGATAGE